MDQRKMCWGKWILGIWVFTLVFSTSLSLAAEHEKIMVIYGKNRDYAMDATVAREKGYFDELKLAFDSKYVRGGSAATISAILSNEFDGAFMASSAALAAAAKGVKIAQVCGICKQQGYFNYVVLKNSPIKSLKDFNGKTIATSRKPGGAWLALRYDLDKFKINTNVIQMKSRGEQFSALFTGEVVACYSNPTSEALYGDKIRIVHTSTISKYLFNSCGWWFKKGFIDTHPEAVKRFVTGLSMARTFIETNPEEAADILIKNAKLNIEKFQKPIILPKFDNPPVIYAYGLRRVNEILQEYSLMDTKVDVSKIIDGRFARVIDEDY